MNESNPIYRLAVKPVAHGDAHLSDLLAFLERHTEWELTPPAEHTDFETYFDWAEKSPTGQRCYWASVGLRTALAGGHPFWPLRGASIIAREAPASDGEYLLAEVGVPTPKNSPGQPYHNLLCGLHALIRLRAIPSQEVDIPTLQQLDDGLGGGRPSEMLLLLARESAGGWRESHGVESWQDLVNQVESGRSLSTTLRDLYANVLLAFHYRAEAERWIERTDPFAESVLSANEVLETPGLEYLTQHDREEVERRHKMAVTAAEQGQHMARRLLAVSLTEYARFEPMQALLAFSAANVERSRRAFDDAKSLLESAERGSSPDSFLSFAARHLLADVCAASGDPERATTIWNALLSTDLANLPFRDLLAREAEAGLGALAMSSGRPTDAREHYRRALQLAERGLREEPFQRVRTSLVSLLDNAFAAFACAEDARSIVESWESHRTISLREALHLAPAGCDELCAELEPGEGILYLGVGSRGTAFVLLTHAARQAMWLDGFSWSHLTDAAGPWLKANWHFEQSLALERRLVPQAEDRMREALDRTLDALRPLLEPAAKLLAGSHVASVILIPGRGLGGLPLHAVPIPRLATGADIFGDLARVTYAPSATFWLWAKRTAPSRALARGFAGFPEDEDEVAAAAKLWSSQCTRVNAPPGESDWGKLRGMLADASVAHISCHGQFTLGSEFLKDDERENVRAWLKLPHERVDWLTLLEQLRLPSMRLVVLSACETSAVNPHDRVSDQFGIAFAFLARGAPLVLASLWVVDYAATALLVTRFHEDITTERRPSIALTEAQGWLRTRQRPELADEIERLFGSAAAATWKPPNGQPLPYQHPYFWAGFRLIGADFDPSSAKTECS